MIRPANWTPALVARLRLRLYFATLSGLPTIVLPTEDGASGEPVTIEYAQHVLACLEEAQPREATA